jgi:hypothetical protein
MEDNSYLSLVYAFFNQYLFNDAKINIDDLSYYFKTNPSTAGNSLIENLLGAIKDYGLESMTYPLFQGILLKTGKTENEGKQILDEIIKYKKMSKDEIEPARKYLKDLVATVYIQRAERVARNSPAEYVNYLKSINFKSTNEDYLSPVSLNKVDINTVVADTNSAYLTSSMDFINGSFTENAYKSTDIVVISASPSVGKSLFAETEALHMVLKHKVPVIVFTMGDIDMASLVLRFATIYSGLSFRETRMRLPEIYNEMSKNIGDLLDLVVVPAGAITAKDAVDYILNSNKHYAAAVFDYDENFKIESKDGSMYNDFGEIYNEYTRLSQAGILCFSLSQPKVGVWSNDLIQLADLGTSSRKGHIASVVITVSKVPDIPNDLVTFYIPKNRHGVNDKSYCIRLQNAKFKPIPKTIWEDIKKLPERRDFTEQEIDSMVGMYNQSRQQVNNQIQNKMNQQGFKPSTNPFAV